MLSHRGFDTSEALDTTYTDAVYMMHIINVRARKARDDDVLFTSPEVQFPNFTFLSVLCIPIYHENIS